MEKERERIDKVFIVGEDNITKYNFDKYVVKYIDKILDNNYLLVVANQNTFDKYVLNYISSRIISYPRIKDQVYVVTADESQYDGFNTSKLADNNEELYNMMITMNEEVIAFRFDDTDTFIQDILHKKYNPAFREEFLQDRYQNHSKKECLDQQNNLE